MFNVNIVKKRQSVFLKNIGWLILRLFDKGMISPFRIQTIFSDDCL
jgi:hypothetical protein